jgi:RecA/RadA recombinase
MAKKKFDLEAYKKSIEVADTPLKPDKFVVLDECLQEVVGMPGFALGHISQIFGPSDSGKTSLLFHAAAKAQEQGLLVCLIITEGKIDLDRARSMGFDPDTAIVNQNCEFLEDVFKFIDKITADVASGEIPQDVLILFDSVGNTLSRDEVEIQADGTWEKKATMMKAAKVISENMRTISKKINDTRKISYPHSVGLVVINQAYTQPPQFPGGMPSLVPYGGNAIWYRSSLVLRTKRTKKLSATKSGIDYGFGIVSKITVDKNHISNTTNSGEFVITADAIIPNDKTAIADYKESRKNEWGTEFEIAEIEA